MVDQSSSFEERLVDKLKASNFSRETKPNAMMMFLSLLVGLVVFNLYRGGMRAPDISEKIKTTLKGAQWLWVNSKG